MNEYTPQIFKKQSHGLAYGLMVVELRKCPICEKWMLNRSNSFPNMDENREVLQLQRAGWVHKSSMENNNMDYICEECKTHARVKFTCAICGEERTSSEIQEQFGYPAEYLCKECYSKVSAKEWDVKVEELDTKHHWDFE